MAVCDMGEQLLAEKLANWWRNRNLVNLYPVLEEAGKYRVSWFPGAYSWFNGVSFRYKLPGSPSLE